MHRLAKAVLNPVLPSNSGMSLTSALEIIVNKGRRKNDSTKRDKSYWEHVSIAHRKIQKSSRYRSGSRLGSGSGSVGKAERHGPLGVEVDGVLGWSRDGNYRYMFVAYFVYEYEHQWPENTRYTRAYPAGDSIHVNVM
ncbi:hypothetical protein M9H77_34998 [Catharanthus roseus]|uniref:Uncharacterized protein n=1 Tax=Catharanthus roseus TaxID=4058 RepID=A0ACB9ZN25_CATRO|nr:hypothetical protein M9H77_34998 [Catharanthus roseus]